jgi:Spy/CpxP family protein refolding chaperone
MKARLLGVSLLLGAVTVPAAAYQRPAPYAGQQARTIKALAPGEVAALLNGEGLGLAMAAELNGYPGPAPVLSLAGELKLTPLQRSQVQAIFARMSAAAKPLGGDVVERERGLDQLFATGEVDPDRLRAATAAIAELQGRLRSVHLAAHLETRALLSADQIALYHKLRGYAGPGSPTQHHHHG